MICCSCPTAGEVGNDEKRGCSPTSSNLHINRFSPVLKPCLTSWTMCNPFFYLPIPKGVYSLPKKLLINKFFFFFVGGGQNFFKFWEGRGSKNPPACLGCEHSRRCCTCSSPLHCSVAATGSRNNFNRAFHYVMGIRIHIRRCLLEAKNRIDLMSFLRSII